MNEPNIVHFKFHLGDHVLISEIGRPGIVESMRYDGFGKMCLIAYWNDGTRKSEWLYEKELEKRG